MVSTLKKEGENKNTEYSPVTVNTLFLWLYNLLKLNEGKYVVENKPKLKKKRLSVQNMRDKV